jgi:hypothetical protein
MLLVQTVLNISESIFLLFFRLSPDKGARGFLMLQTECERRLMRRRLANIDDTLCAPTPISRRRVRLFPPLEIYVGIVEWHTSAHLAIRDDHRVRYDVVSPVK